MKDSSPHSERHSPDTDIHATQNGESFSTGEITSGEINSYVVLATIAGESTPQGKTPVQLTHHQNPFHP